MKIMIDGDPDSTLTALEYAELVVPEIGIVKLTAILIGLITEGVSVHKDEFNRIEEVRLVDEFDNFDDEDSV